MFECFVILECNLSFQHRNTDRGTCSAALSSGISRRQNVAVILLLCLCRAEPKGALIAYYSLEQFLEGCHRSWFSRGLEAEQPLWELSLGSGLRARPPRRTMPKFPCWRCWDGWGHTGGLLQNGHKPGRNGPLGLSSPPVPGLGTAVPLFAVLNPR